ncbi:UNVERIFIED_CONTAM: hypothetical protein Scaly_2272900 [Sesamum calycinum]|uniref:Uncharacterized protein n=1 Tax=Sesamum calycinum TaxID=2727403 RepID=A0AAW2MDD0_9LAMI
MSVERSFEAWEEVQRHGLDLADKLAQGFTDSSPINGVTAIFDIGNRIGQAGADFGACLNGVVHQFFRRLPVPFRHDENTGMSLGVEGHGTRTNMGITLQEDLGSLAERFKDYGFSENGAAVVETSTEDETFGVNAKALKHLGRSQVASLILTIVDIVMRVRHLSYDQNLVIDNACRFHMPVVVVVFFDMPQVDSSLSLVSPYGSYRDATLRL